MECYCYLRNVQDLLADGQTLHERRFYLPFEWPIIPFWSRSKNLSNINQRPRSTASVRHNNLFWNAEGSWNGDVLVVDTEGLKTMPQYVTHAGTPKEETPNLYSHAGRATSCKKDSRYPPLCIQSGGRPRQEPQYNSSEEKEEAEIQAKMLKLHKISVV